MKRRVSSLEKKIKQSGTSYFASFERPHVLNLPHKVSFWKRTWTLPSLLSTSFGVLLVALTLQATQAQGAFESGLGLTPLNTVVYPRWNETLSSENETVSTLPTMMRPFIQSSLAPLASRNENIVYSPLSSYMTLAMLYEASEGSTQDELMTYLNIEEEGQWREALSNVFQSTYQQRYQGSQPLVQSRLANAMFIRDTYPIASSYTQQLADTYFAEVFHTNFDATSRQSIADWINQKTNDFLSVQPEELSIQDSTQWLLYNTLYMRSNWLTPFEESLTHVASFTPEGQTSVDVNMMKKTLGSAPVFQGEDFTMIEDQAYGKYQFHYLLPNLDTTLTSLLERESFLEDVETAMDQTTLQEVALLVPQFSIDKTLDLKPWMMNHIPSLFDPSYANLSKAGEGLFVQSLRQDVRLDVFEQGFEAAAVTEADVGTTSAPIPPSLEIRMDRSFLVLVTHASGLIHFISIVHSPLEA